MSNVTFQDLMSTNGPWSDLVTLVLLALSPVIVLAAAVRLLALAADCAAAALEGR